MASRWCPSLALVLSTVVFRGLLLPGLVPCWAGWSGACGCWGWSQGGGPEPIEGITPFPVGGQVQDQASGSVGEAGGEADDPGP